MYQLKISDEVRRFIGDNLLEAHYGQALPISAISEATGISRVSLKRWIDSDLRLYWLTAHIPDATVNRISWQHDSRDSRFFLHAAEYRRRVQGIRRRATSGELGPDIQKAELDRKHNENAARKN